MCSKEVFLFTVYRTSFVLTGSEYSRMAMKRITMKRRRSPMKRHLNLRHTMNFMVLHGLVNQKKDVSGRLLEKKRFWSLNMFYICFIQITAPASYLGESSLGFMLGSSLPFPAGLTSASASFTISRLISTLPWKHRPMTSERSEKVWDALTDLQGEKNLELIIIIETSAVLKEILNHNWLKDSNNIYIIHIHIKYVLKTTVLVLAPQTFL